MERWGFYAIAIDDLRDIFGASPELADRLKASAAREFAQEPPPKQGLLSKLGPLRRRAAATEVDARNPTQADMTALLTGGFVAPERGLVSWKLLVTWLDELASDRLVIETPSLTEIDFDLARNGLPSPNSIDQFQQRDLGVPLRPVQDQRVGYLKHNLAVETAAALTQLLDSTTELEAATRKVVEELLGFLTVLDTPTQPPLDVVVVQLPG